MYENGKRKFNRTTRTYRQENYGICLLATITAGLFHRQLFVKSSFAKNAERGTDDGGKKPTTNIQQPTNDK